MNEQTKPAAEIQAGDEVMWDDGSWLTITEVDGPLMPDGRTMARTTDGELLRFNHDEVVTFR